MMRARAVVAALLLLAIVLGTVEIARTADPAVAASADPCSGLNQTQVASAFGVKKIELVTRGKQDFARSCFFSTQGQGGPCVAALTVFITTERYRDKAAAGEAYAVHVADGQALPNGDPPEGEALATETLSGLGSAAYFTNRRGGSVVALDGKLIRAFGGGFIVPSTALGCDRAALHSVNRDGLLKLAAKVTPPRKAAAAPSSNAVETVTGVLGGERENTKRRGAPCLWVDTATGRVQVLIDVDAIGQTPVWVGGGGPFESIRAVDAQGRPGEFVARAADRVTVTGTRLDADSGCGDYAVVPTTPISAGG